MSKSHAVYRFYRNEFTPLVWGILVSVSVGLGLMAVIFSPSISFEAHERVEPGPEIFVVDRVADEGDLRDSEPLFLPTGWNYRLALLQEELKSPFLNSFSFGGIHMLEVSEGDKLFVSGERVTPAKVEDVFLPKAWGVASGFGYTPTWQRVSAGSGDVVVRVADSETGEFVVGGSFSMKELPAPTMLLAPVEIIYYGAQDVPQMFIVQSCGDAEVDRRVLDAVRFWGRERLRSRRVLLIHVRF